jgi:hypothetical protein
MEDQKPPRQICPKVPLKKQVYRVRRVDWDIPEYLVTIHLARLA